MTVLSKTQIDRLGDRLRGGSQTEDDLRLLDGFRLSFRPAYDHVYRMLRETFSLEPTGRSGKSTPAIVDKLRRESIRLSQMQDIAGCRIVVRDTDEQDHLLATLPFLFGTDRSEIIDRRQRPSHGYRAVHIVVRVEGRPIEVQIRTELQDRWAQVSEKLADLVDKRLKYGGGPDVLRDLLATQSSLIAELESLGSPRDMSEDLQNRRETLRQKMLSTMAFFLDQLRALDQVNFDDLSR